jgi:hypothetical protein
MFRMTCDIKIGAFKPVKPNAVKWSRHITNFTDTSTVKLPAIAMLKSTGDIYEQVQTGLQIKEGMKVEVIAGYDGRNVTRFKGFVSRVNFTIPLEVDCEGYSYQLRKKLDINKSYVNTTAKKILIDLVQGTDIKLSEAIPDIPIEKAGFKDCNGINVLEWLKENCKLTVYFNFDILYVGLEQAETIKTVKFRLGWNVIKDNALKFNDKKEFADVRIQLSGRKKDGTKEKAFIGKKDGQVKRIKTVIKDKVALNAIIKQKQREIVNKGYEGQITTFLEPVINPGEAAHIDDLKYTERTGKYFITGIDGDFDHSGGRVKIKIGNSLGNG